MPVSYNQISIPAFMYGTAWKKDATTRLVELAVQTGFTAIDTANQLIHYDEARVGEALKAVQASGAITRDALFLQTKYTSAGGQDHRTPYDASADLTTQVRQSMDSSLAHLHTDYVDSYVLHGPHSRRGLLAEDWEVWTAMEDLLTAGKTRMLGASNVNAGQLMELCAQAKTKPMVVQNRCYATMGWDQDVRQICRDNNIIYQGFSLLTANSQYLQHPLVRATAKRLGTGTAQVIFAFSMQIGMLPLTGTTNATHMREDLDAQSLRLTDEEVRDLETIALSVR